VPTQFFFSLIGTNPQHTNNFSWDRIILQTLTHLDLKSQRVPNHKNYLGKKWLAIGIHAHHRLQEASTLLGECEEMMTDVIETAEMMFADFVAEVAHAVQM